jgi:hypothetical protein
VSQNPIQQKSGMNLGDLRYHTTPSNGTIIEKSQSCQMVYIAPDETCLELFGSIFHHQSDLKTLGSLFSVV